MSDSGRDVSERIRALRTDAGMSQAELAAATGLSNGYISLLETGQRAPSSTALVALARALGTSSDYLREGRSGQSEQMVANALEQARAALRQGRPTQARDVLLTLEPGSITRDHRYEVLATLARAREGTGDTPGSIESYEQALDAARRDNRPKDAAETAMWLIGAHLDAADLDSAVAVGERALAELDGAEIEGSDEHLRLGSTVMWAWFERGDYLHAAHQSALLTQLAETKGSTRGRGSVLWNAALIAQARGDDGLGLDLASRALRSMEEAGWAEDLPRMRYDYAFMLLRCSPPRPSEALVQLELAETGLAAVGTPFEQARCLTEQAGAHLLLGNVDRATELVEAGLTRAGASTSLDVCEGHLTCGDLAVERGDLAQAHAAYGRASNFLARNPPSSRGSSMWAALAARMDALNDAPAALHAYRQALAFAHVRAASPLGLPSAAR